eukprot:363746-Chlamydomonas_euryale.AAC.4
MRADGVGCAGMSWRRARRCQLPEMVPRRAPLLVSSTGDPGHRWSARQRRRCRDAEAAKGLARGADDEPARGAPPPPFPP